jgi:hypothetical protein
MKPQKLLMVLGVSILIYYVARQVQIRNNYVENFIAEDRRLSDSDIGIINDYYRSITDNKPIDPSKLENKQKVFINTVTAHPFTAVTDNIIRDLSEHKVIPQNSRAAANLFIVSSLLRVISTYSHKYVKSKSIPTREIFVKNSEEIIKGIRAAMESIQSAQNQMSFNPNEIHHAFRDHFTRVMAPLRGTYIALFGDKLLTKNPDGTHSINMSGPFQINLIDLTYAYLYPPLDIFTWLQLTFSGEN